jgi:tetratricopeptide (TPR) repeat protein
MQRHSFNLFLLWACFFSFTTIAQTNPKLLAYFEKVAQNNTKSSLAIFNVGQYHFFTKNFVEAQKYFSQAVELDTQDSDYYFFRAVAYEGQGQYENALNDYDKAINTHNTTEYLMRRAWLRYKLKKYVGAAQDFKVLTEDYEDMADAKRALQECKKQAGDFESKTAEANATTAKLTADAPAVFVDKFIKLYEKFSDAGELYRGLENFCMNNIDKSLPIFQEIIQKDQDAEAFYFYAIAQEMKGNDKDAQLNYQYAIREVEKELQETKFEQYAGSPKADNTLTRLTNLQTDYQFALNQLNQRAGSPSALPLEEDMTNLRGEVRSASQIYTCYITPKDKANEYQLDIKNKMGDKVMLALIRLEKQGNNYMVKIMHGNKKEGLTWELLPNDLLVGKFSPNNLAYNIEGNRLQTAKNPKIDLATLAKLKPREYTLKEVLLCAAKTYMVAFIIKD